MKNDGNPYAPLDSVVEPEVEVVEVETEAIPEDVTTIKQILEWVGENKDRANLVLSSENESETPRSTLIHKLEEVING